MAFIIHITEEVQLIAPPPSKLNYTEEGVICTLSLKESVLYV